MTIAINCKCGNIFEVKDEMAGRNVRCQSCREIITVPVATAVAQLVEPTARPIASTLPSTNRCPKCDEAIPELAVVCPFCACSLTKHLPTSVKENLLNKITTELNDHICDHDKLLADEKLRSGFLTARTIVGIVITAIGIFFLLVAILDSSANNAGAFGALGFFITLIAGISTLVSFSNDYKAKHIQDAPDAIIAYKRFISAVQTGRTAKAFAALAPTTRNKGTVETLKFDKFGYSKKSYKIVDLRTFKEYWKSIFRGPGGQTRSVRLKEVAVCKVVEENVVEVEATYSCSAFPTLMFLLILLNLIICLIAIAVVQAVRKEPKTVRKLMIKRDGKWYLADAEFEGIYDAIGR